MRVQEDELQSDVTVDVLFGHSGSFKVLIRKYTKKTVYQRDYKNTDVEFFAWG